MWDKRYGGEGYSEIVYLEALTLGRDGNLVAVGNPGGELSVLKISGDGEIIWEKTYEHRVFSSKTLTLTGV